MVNFICQFDWVIGYPDIWSNIILGVLWGCFCMRLALKSVDRVKQIALPLWNASNQLKAWIEQKCWPSAWLRGNSACPVSFELGFYLPLHLNWNFGFSGSRACRPPEYNHTSALLVLWPLHLNWNYIPLTLHLADLPWKSWDLSPSIITWANSL